MKKAKSIKKINSKIKEEKMSLEEMMKGYKRSNAHKLVHWGPDVGREIIPLFIPTIKCKNFVLRPLNLKDANSIAKYGNNKKIFKNLTDKFPRPYKLEDAKKFIKIISSTKNQNHYAFGIEIEGEFCGIISLVLKNQYKASFGYWLGESFWGRGVMTEALKRVSMFGFKDLKLKRIYACVYPQNPASASVLIKNGFKQEGYHKKDEYHMGKMMDTITFAKVR